MKRSTEDFQEFVEEELGRGKDRMDTMDGRITDLKDQLQSNEELLAANTAATNQINANTKELVEAFESWKGAMQVLEWIGRIAKPVAAIIGVVSACMAVYAAWRAR